MSIIKILPDHVSNKIAAGEVIERPASVVKELVENALDAHAKRIAVRVERAGQRLISVSDDGDGMDPDDAILCFEPHATSKIATEEDILHISSFGFRGEAMPSIASVSRMTVRTRKRDSQEGIQVSVQGGVMQDSVPVGCAPGTETTVRDLFYNIPARKKFLKSNSTEERHITEVVSLISLAHPDVAFELMIDNRRILSSGAGEDLMPRIRDIYGRDLADAMVPISYETERIRVRGCITRRGVTRPTRQEQRTFVNDRPVESLPIYRGIKEGCGPMLDKGRYHPAVLFLTLDPALVDINVHPAKREVRFRNEFEVALAVRSAVAEALSAAAREDNPFLAGSPGDRRSPEEFSGDANANPSRETPVPSSTSPRSPSDKPEEEQSLPSDGTTSSVQFRPRPAFSAASAMPQGAAAPQPTAPRTSFDRILLAAKVDYRPIGILQVRTVPDLFRDQEETSGPVRETARTYLTPAQTADAGTRSFPGREGLKVLGFFENSYIIATMKDGIVLIDQHAAHERVLYEKLLKKNRETLSQKLLIPITLDLSRAERMFIEKNHEIFERLGFEVDTFGENTVKLNAIPAAMRQDNAGGVFQDILARITEDGTFTGRTDAAKLAQAACKAAVKAHDKLNMEECSALLEQMAQCDLPFCCPHGRPTVIHLSKQEIERRFGRR